MRLEDAVTGRPTSIVHPVAEGERVHPSTVHRSHATLSRVGKRSPASKPHPVGAVLKAPFGIHSLLDVLVFGDIVLKAASETHIGAVVTGLGILWALVRIIALLWDSQEAFL